MKPQALALYYAKIGLFFNLMLLIWWPNPMRIVLVSTFDL